MDVEIDELLKELNELRAKHAELEAKINENIHLSTINQIALQRIKKEKLWIKDRIKYLESLIYPDIIA